MTISELVKAVGECNRRRGIYDNDIRPAEYLMQITSELAEVYEELRAGNLPDDGYYVEDERGNPKPSGAAPELADVVMACCGYAAYFRIDLEEAIEQKLSYDRIRPVRDKGA